MATTALQTVNTQLTPLEREKQTAINTCNQIMANDNSLARKVYKTSSDKEHPDFQPILRFLRQEGYKRLESVSRLPALQEQGRYEEIADLILSGPDARYLQGFALALTKQTRLDVWRPGLEANEASLLTVGLEEMGIKDKTYVELFQDRDLLRIIDYMKEHDPQVFCEIPQDGPESRRRQLHYVEDWKTTLSELGKSVIRARCRKAGVPDTKIGEYKPGVKLNDPDTSHITREAILYQIRKDRAINKTIQSLDYFVRDGEEGTGDVFAFVERVEPKGLGIICHKGLSPMGILEEILFKGDFCPRHPNELSKELKSFQEYESMGTAKSNKFGKILTWGGAAVGLIGAWSTGATTEYTLLTGIATTLLSAYGHARYCSKALFDVEALNRACQSLPFPGLSEQARRNYMMMYRLEGLTQPYQSSQEKVDAAYAANSAGANDY